MMTLLVDREWYEYPLGTKAQAIMGGHWIKRKNGWQWNGNSGTFPTPGGDNSGYIILPDNGLGLIFQERYRQINTEGWTKEHDSQHKNNELAIAAKCYETPEEQRLYKSHSFFGEETKFCPVDWPWEPEWWKPCPNDRVREFVKSGALYMAANDVDGYSRYNTKINAIADKIDELRNLK